MILVFSILPFQYFFIFKQYAEGLGNTRIAMAITISANFINIAFNYFLIYGKIGLPAMGLNGAGVATLISRLFMPLAFVLVYRHVDFFKPERTFHKKTIFNREAAIKLIRIGLPIAGQSIVEVLTFSLGSIMMGWLGEKALAAHQIVLSLASFTFMAASGLAAATTIKVSHYKGQNNKLAIVNSVKASLLMVTIFMLCSVTAFMLLRYKIPGWFVPDAEVIEIAGNLMLIAGFFQIFDGLQVISLGALRGLEDVKYPMLFLLIAYFAIALPTSYIASFVIKAGPQGIWLGYMLGLIMVATLLLFRFRWKMKTKTNA
jgi:MATE family multidrug resistance protein